VTQKIEQVCLSEARELYADATTPSPDSQRTLLTLTRPSESLHVELAAYWFAAPSVALVISCETDR